MKPEKILREDQMATLTVRIPDDKNERLKALASHKNISINRLMEELSTQALTEFDSEIHFKAFANTGNKDKGLKILDKLERHFGS